MVDEERRELGPEMKAEGWWSTGGDWLLWMDEPSHRAVTVHGARWNSCIDIPALHDPPEDPTTDGYIVGCSVRDEGGEPVEGECFWTPSYGEAVRWARKIRESIIKQRRKHIWSDQLTLDDVLEKQRREVGT